MPHTWDARSQGRGRVGAGSRVGIDRAATISLMLEAPLWSEPRADSLSRSPQSRDYLSSNMAGSLLERGVYRHVASPEHVYTEPREGRVRAACTTLLVPPQYRHSVRASKLVYERVLACVSLCACLCMCRVCTRAHSEREDVDDVSFDDRNFRKTVRAPIIIAPRPL